MEIGVDIAKISDFEGKEENFYRVFLHGEEYERYKAIKSEKRKKEYAASRWAAKEAIYKATQDKGYMKYEIMSEESGKPYVKEHPELKLTLSHHGEYAIAFVIKTEEKI